MVGDHAATSLVDDHRSCLVVGDIGIRVKAQNDMLLHIPKDKRVFFADCDRPHIRVSVVWRETLPEPAGEKLFDSGGLWRLYLDQGNYHFRFSSPVYGSSPYKVAVFDPDLTSGKIYLNRRCFREGVPVDPLEYPLDELLVLHWLSKGRGVEIHALGLVDSSGRGYLFVGQSGAGKSTMAQIWQSKEQVKILSDDRIILRENGGHIWMYGTPWHGEAAFGCPDKALLSEVFFLRQAAANRLEAVSVTESIAYLFSCAFPPFHDATALGFTLNFLEGVAKRLPCRNLYFTPSETALDCMLKMQDSRKYDKILCSY